MIVIPIPLGMDVEITLKGRAPRLVQCEACGYEYVYILETTATGQGYQSFWENGCDGEGVAQAQAEALMDQAMRQECAVVPSADCGRVQAHMFAAARRQYRRWMLTTGLYLFPVSGILVFPATMATLTANQLSGAWGQMLSGVLWSCVVVLFVTAGALIYLRALWQSRYDPNALPVDYRIRWGSGLSVSKADFLKMLQRPPSSAAHGGTPSRDIRRSP